jgi:hypothetical protein
MPFYEVDVTSPANTPATNPTQVLIRLQKGVIVQWEVAIPPGVQGLTGSYVRRGGHQIVPANPDAYLKGDDDRITWQDNYVLEDEPLTLALLTWNLDDSYPHTITFRINVVSLADAEDSLAAPGLLKRIGQYLGLGG